MGAVCAVAVVEETYLSVQCGPMRLLPKGRLCDKPASNVTLRCRVASVGSLANTNGTSLSLQMG